MEKQSDGTILTVRAGGGVAMDGVSQRTIDENGFLHVGSSHVSKEIVNPYYGREIPRWRELGLDPEHIYHGYRSGAELKKAAPTFNGLPLLRDHHEESAATPQKEHRVGSLGTDAAWNAPYLDNSLIITDAAAIREIEDGTRMELSAAYMYDPDFTPGTFEGTPYDFVMRNIHGNHVALVPEGRAGPDVVVADAQLTPNAEVSRMKKGAQARAARARAVGRIALALDADPGIEKTEVDLGKALLAVNEVEAQEEGLSKEEIGLDEDKNAKIKDIIAKYFADASPETLTAITDALTELAYSTSERGTDDADPDTADAGKDENVTPDVSTDGEMHKAMDKVGCDADDPAQQKAFAEGVKYAERLVCDPEERKKLDAEHEAEGAVAAMDATLKRGGYLRATDFQAVMDAQRDVRPVVGELVVDIAHDSATDIYGKALRVMGINPAQHPRAAWRSVFMTARGMQDAGRSIARDAAPRALTGPFSHLQKIRVEG